LGEEKKKLVGQTKRRDRPRERKGFLVGKRGGGGETFYFSIPMPPG